MRLLMAFLAPPLAVRRLHRPRQLRLNLLLTLCLWLPGAVHAALLTYEDSRRRHRPRLGRPNPFGL